MMNREELRRLAETATPGPWFWWGNSDNHSIALCGRQPGLGACEVISTVSVERSTTGREADQLRSDLAEYTDMSLSEIEDAVQEWAFDEYGQPRIDQRLSVTDENHIRRAAEELAVYEVARAQGLPDDTPRDHERIYRADVCDLRATNARYIAAANPAAVLDLLDQLDAAEARLAAIEATDKSKLSIQYGWLVYDVGEHTCGGCGPESGYMHEPGCGYEPLLRLDELTGWPGNALDAAEARLAAVRDIVRDVAIDAGDDRGTYGETYHAGMVIVAARIRQALAIGLPPIQVKGDPPMYRCRRGHLHTDPIAAQACTDAWLTDLLREDHRA